SAYDDKATQDKSLENVYGFFAEHTFSPTEHWENSLAARLDSSNIYHKLITLRAATSATFNNEQTRVFASAGRGYRAPGQLQRSNSSYQYWGSTYHGNPNLECETSYSVDLGAEQQIAEGHTAGATLFRVERRHAIETVHPSYTDAYFRNAEARQIAKGIELSLKGKFDADDKSGYRVAYTYTVPRVSKHEQIANSARQCWSAELYTTPLPGFTTGLGLTAAVGRTDYNAERSDNYYTLRWFAQYEVNDNLTLHLRIENLTNQKFVTEPVKGNASADMLCPGISIYGGCTVKF
ncbi:MAG: TonB-dependent receptor plug domain-containing protein, partial [Akkermansia sp.]